MSDIAGKPDDLFSCLDKVGRDGLQAVCCESRWVLQFRFGERSYRFSTFPAGLPTRLWAVPNMNLLSEKSLFPVSLTELSDNCRIVIIMKG